MRIDVLHYQTVFDVFLKSGPGWTFTERGKDDTLWLSIFKPKWEQTKYSLERQIDTFQICAHLC